MNNLVLSIQRRKQELLILYATLHKKLKNDTSNMFNLTFKTNYFNHKMVKNDQPPLGDQLC